MTVSSRKCINHFTNHIDFLFFYRCLFPAYIIEIHKSFDGKIPNNYDPRFTSSFKFHPSKCYFQTSLIPKCYNYTTIFIWDFSSSLFGGLLDEHFLLARKFSKYYESKSHQFCKQKPNFQQFHHV